MNATNCRTTQPSLKCTQKKKTSVIVHLVITAKREINIPNHKCLVFPAWTGHWGVILPASREQLLKHDFGLTFFPFPTPKVSLIFCKYDLSSKNTNKYVPRSIGYSWKILMLSYPVWTRLLWMLRMVFWRPQQWRPPAGWWMCVTETRHGCAEQLTGWLAYLLLFRPC